MTREYPLNKYNIEYFFSKPLFLPAPFNLLLKDYKYSNIPNYLKNQIDTFNFPEGMPDRINEIEIEKMYSSLIIQSIIKESENVVSGVQFFNKKKSSDMIPLEKSFKLSKNGKILGQFDIAEDTGGQYKVVEVGRLQILIRNVIKSKRKILAQLTLWSVWLFIVNYKIDFVYCMADSKRPELQNFYKEKLLFKEVAKVKYNDSDTKWIVYRRNFIDDRKNRPLCPSIPYLEDFYFNILLPICNQ